CDDQQWICGIVDQTGALLPIRLSSRPQNQHDELEELVDRHASTIRHGTRIDSFLYRFSLCPIRASTHGRGDCMLYRGVGTTAWRSARHPISAACLSLDVLVYRRDGRPYCSVLERRETPTGECCRHPRNRSTRG